MGRTAAETADLLSKLFEHKFGQDYSEPFQITWPQLRSLAIASRLSEYFLKSVNIELSESGYSLIPLNYYLLIAREHEFDHYRKVPDRLLEQYLPYSHELTCDSDDEIEGDDL
jgi:hypothetical protein